jgi:hypothetical protein
MPIKEINANLSKWKDIGHTWTGILTTAEIPKLTQRFNKIPVKLPARYFEGGGGRKTKVYCRYRLF